MFISGAMGSILIPTDFLEIIMVKVLVRILSIVGLVCRSWKMNQSIPESMQRYLMVYFDTFDSVYISFVRSINVNITLFVTQKVVYRFPIRFKINLYIKLYIYKYISAISSVKYVY